MNYYNKFIKYQSKLEGGSNLTVDIKQTFDTFFGNNWILTGSEAIKKYLQHFNITEFEFPTNDVDIYFISKDDFTMPIINGYKRKQENPTSSMTFINESINKSFDITVSKRSMYYYEIDGIKLDTPKNMLDNYEENLELRNNHYDSIKINALRKIIEVLNPEDKLKLELENNKKRRVDNQDENEGERLRFTHIPISPNRLLNPIRNFESPKNLRQALRLDELTEEPKSPPNLRKALSLDDLTKE